MKNCNQRINGFAENIEQHSRLIHNFFNENRELFLKDEQLRDEFLKRQQENHETIRNFVKSIEDEFIGKFIMIDNSHNFPNTNNKGYYKIIGVHANTYDGVFGFGISLVCSGFDVAKPENFGKNEVACNFTTKTYIPFSDEYFKDFIIRTNWEIDEKSIEPFEKECNPRYGILSFITEDDFKAEYRKHTEAMLEDMLNAKYL